MNDYDNASGRAYFWWLIQKQTDIFLTPGKFISEKRHVYASPSLKGTSKFAKAVIIKDGEYIDSTASNTESVDFSWRNNKPSGKTYTGK